MGLFNRLKSKFTTQKPVRLGLSLGSGGAKGMAHIGALKAFEEEGITFQMVTGTSIGSIVGALYVKGYSSRDIIEVIESLNRKEFAKNLRPFSDMDFAEQFIGQFVEENIEELPLPYACCATNAETNEMVVLKKGNTARACTASSAMPPFFKGVQIDGKKLFDGAFTNSVPADICKELGADFVIGIDLGAFTKSEDEKSRFSRLLGSAINAFVSVKYLDDSKTRGYDAADIMLRPNLHDYRATDVSVEDMNAMYELGYQEARSHMEEIKTALKNAGILTDKKRKS
ncbi:MAG: patatin-like phospholipase family protein [Clostridia bacterium]|nr:patatin-like phospholipase family protein [Clostridia bacterium]